MADDTTFPADAVKKLHSRLDKQDDLLCDIKTALLGNTEFGQVGLVARVSAVELDVKRRAEAAELATVKAQVDSHDRKLWLATITLSAVWAAVVTFKEKLFK